PVMRATLPLSLPMGLPGVGRPGAALRFVARSSRTGAAARSPVVGAWRPFRVRQKEARQRTCRTPQAGSFERELLSGLQRYRFGSFSASDGRFAEPGRGPSAAAGAARSGGTSFAG